MISMASASSGQPACANASQAWMAGRSMNSSTTGIMPEAMIESTQAPAISQASWLDGSGA
jgi:hypothetical protein